MVITGPRRGGDAVKDLGVLLGEVVAVNTALAKYE
jgi:hypothetical protein